MALKSELEVVMDDRQWRDV